MAHKGHYALFYNTFRIIKYAFQIMQNTFQILRNITTNSEIFATHFEIFATHSPQDPKCWQRKRNGYAAPPPSFDAMFCSHVWTTTTRKFCFLAVQNRFETLYLKRIKIQRWNVTVTQGKSDPVKHSSGGGEEWGLMGTR